MYVGFSSSGGCLLSPSAFSTANAAASIDVIEFDCLACLIIIIIIIIKPISIAPWCPGTEALTVRMLTKSAGEQ